jgi:hypothetical protein
MFTQITKSVALAAALTLAATSASTAAPKQRNSAQAQARAAFAYTHPYNAYASTQPTFDHSVYVGGRYRGTDPDPNIRAALRRDSGRGGD